MSICVNSIGEVTITLKKDGDVNVGDLVMMSSNQTAKLAENNVDPIGVCVSKNGDYIGVVVSGGVTLEYGGSTLTTGFHPIKVLSKNKIEKADTGKTRLIIDVNTSAKTAQVIL